MAKRNPIVNAFMKKCPRCQEGDLFIKPFEISNPLNMPDHCPVCNQKYLPEPGFYYGAMFLSYIFSAFFFLGIVGICLMVFKMSANAAIGVMLLVAELLIFSFSACPDPYGSIFWLSMTQKPEIKKKWRVLGIEKHGLKNLSLLLSKHHFKSPDDIGTHDRISIPSLILVVHQIFGGEIYL